MAYSRQKVVDTVNGWVGKNEADGSYKSIIDEYNKCPAEQLPRRARMEYGWAWCAATWSAAAVKLGYLEIMPIEISCYYLIEAAKKMGVWVENDAYTPQPGDAVLYDWDDSGTGDNTGSPDHVGTVTYVNTASGYMVATEGNYSNAVKKRTISLNGRYIRGFIRPKYDEGAVTDPPKTGGKSASEIAHEVIAGVWGNGDARKKELEAAGYTYKDVQAEVNKILNGSATQPKQQEQDQAQPVAQKITATCYAREYDKNAKGVYKVTAEGGLYCRNDAGTNKKALCRILHRTEVTCYGYYSSFAGEKWLYIQFVMDGVRYTGFSSAAYLGKKEE